ncbi:MAG TPA: nuclear transport factor 2 family protein [Longimicrobiales bacterium]|nr:nuclear transport factor 2 family protein [Longimicrobiales bacterium]
MTKAALVVALAALLGAPVQAAAQADDEAAIKAVLVDMWDALENGDLDRYAGHLHPDFTSFGETDPYLNEGKAYEMRSVADWTSRVPGVHTEMHQPRVTVRGNTAWITYYWTDAGVSREGVRQTSAGKSTRIFVKEGGRWLCIHGHYTLAP